MSQEIDANTVQPAQLGGGGRRGWRPSRRALALAVIAILIGAGVWRYYASPKVAPAQTAAPPAPSCTDRRRPLSSRKFMQATSLSF